MRIGIPTDVLLKAHAGVEVVTKTLIQGLVSEGQDVMCFSPKHPAHPRIPGVKQHWFRRPLPLPFYPRLAAFFRLKCFNNLDVLHVPSPQFPYFLKPKCPVVVTVHDVIPRFAPHHHNWKRAVFFKHLLPRYLRQVDAIIAVSNTTKNDLMRYYHVPDQKITVIPNALPPVRSSEFGVTSEFGVMGRESGVRHIVSPNPKLPTPNRICPQPLTPNSQPFLLYLGTLEPRKNIERLLIAFAKIKKQGFTHKLVLAGQKGWKYHNIFRLIRTLGLQNDVIYKGYVSDHEKATLYKEATAFVYPSLYEGFGLPVLEAMQYGIPVITSNTSSLPEVAGSAAILVSPRDTEALAEAMTNVLSSTTLQKSLSRKGIKRAKEFSAKKMMQKTLQVYEGVQR